MRTTVTLDPDAEQLLRQAMQQTGESFKSTLNRAIRRGLADTVLEVEEEPFKVEAKDMGQHPGIDYSRMNQFLDDMEVDAHLEVTQKLEQRLAQEGKSQESQGGHDTRKPDLS